MISLKLPFHPVRGGVYVVKSKLACLVDDPVEYDVEKTERGPQAKNVKKL